MLLLWVKSAQYQGDSVSTYKSWHCGERQVVTVGFISEYNFQAMPEDYV